VILVVGGQKRNIGKSGVVAALIRSFPKAGWAAVKITSHLHGDAGPVSVHEETEVVDTDTGRFLAAGAERSYLIRAGAGRLSAALPALREIIKLAPNTIIESNSVLEHLSPDLYLLVAHPAVREWKESAATHLARADAILLVQPPDSCAPLARLPHAVPHFVVHPPEFMTPELRQFLGKSLRAAWDQAGGN
jgi:hypothetical protein